jgi:hypothetical protein
MRPAAALLVIVLLLAACAGPPRNDSASPSPIAIFPSPYEPAAQIDPASQGDGSEGAVIGAAGGAGIGAMSAKASAGLLCTFGGPLCLIVMIPAAIVGGLVGGVAGGVADAITTDPGSRIADARGVIDQAVAEMRLTHAVAAQTHARAGGSAVLLKEANYRALAAQGIRSALEVGVSELHIVAREKEMALVLRARSRLYRTADGDLLDERFMEAQTDFRKYRDWAADGAQTLHRAVDDAIAQLGAAIVDGHLNPTPM